MTNKKELEEIDLCDFRVSILGFSQERFGKYLGLSQASVWRAEEGLTRFNGSARRMIAHAAEERGFKVVYPSPHTKKKARLSQ